MKGMYQMYPLPCGNELDPVTSQRSTYLPHFPPPAPAGPAWSSFEFTFRMKASRGTCGFPSPPELRWHLGAGAPVLALPALCLVQERPLSAAVPKIAFII